jgi:hypothetical protein
MAIEKRSLLKFVLLTIVTLGVYQLFFIYKLAKDVNTICKEDGKKTGGLLAYIFLGMITFGIYQYVWIYMLADRLQDNAQRYNITIKEGPSMILLWYTVGTLIFFAGPFIAVHIVIKNINALADEYNKKISS